MREKRLRIHYYASEKDKRRLVEHISGTLLDERFSDVRWYMKRDWRYGPNIGIYIRPKRGLKKLEEEFIKMVMEETKRYWTSDNAAVIQPKEEVLRQLNTLETQNKDGDEKYLPITDNKSLVLENVEDELKGYFSTKGEYDLYQRKKCECSKLLVKTVGVMNSISEEQQYLLLVCLFAKVAECYPKYGIMKGCISFKSHIIGFLANPDERTGKIKTQFEEIYKTMSRDLLKAYEENFILKENQELIEEWSDFFHRFINSIKYDSKTQSQLKEAGMLTDESQKNLASYTEFHNKWVSRDSFQDFFYSKEFYKYRLLVNFFYLMLPCMGFGPIGKHMCCYLITSTIEEKEEIKFSDMIPA